MQKFLILALLCTFALRAEERITINHMPLSILPEQEIEVEELVGLLSLESPAADRDVDHHILREVDHFERCVVLEDDSVWKIGWWYRGMIKDWKPGHRLRISHFGAYVNNIKLENLDLASTAWGAIEKHPTIEKSEYLAGYSTFTFDPQGRSTLIVSNGAIFKGPSVPWNVRDGVFIFYKNANTYDVWNLTNNEIARDWTLVGNEKEGSSESVLNLPKQLGKRVLGQSEAIETVNEAVVNYWSGFKDPSRPIGVFLFLGPTGVGKTELARQLTNELFKSQEYLIRFDMSHFNESHSTARLLGSPPGYMNHEEGGQLTNAIKDKPKSIVLLDEFEKANQTVQKLFLPVFDDGFITDAKNESYCCTDQIFIMTSNICALEIAELFNRGLSAEDILAIIEPEIISEFSPEFYNRVTPVVFHNLTPDLMSDLVDLQLEEVYQRLEQVRNVKLIVEDSAREYLMINGFHPTLGARPLRRLIQKKIVSTVSYAMIAESIPEGSNVSIAYSEEFDTWDVKWHSKGGTSDCDCCGCSADNSDGPEPGSWDVQYHS